MTHVTVKDWFVSSDAQVSAIYSDDGSLTTQVNALVSAMAAFASNNPGFDPETAMAMPNDSSLQLAINSSWQPY